MLIDKLTVWLGAIVPASRTRRSKDRAYYHGTEELALQRKARLRYSAIHERLAHVASHDPSDDIDCLVLTEGSCAECWH